MIGFSSAFLMAFLLSMSETATEMLIFHVTKRSQPLHNYFFFKTTKGNGSERLSMGERHHEAQRGKNKKATTHNSNKELRINA